MKARKTAPKCTKNNKTNNDTTETNLGRMNFYIQMEVIIDDELYFILDCSNTVILQIVATIIARNTKTWPSKYILSNQKSVDPDCKERSHISL